MTTPDQPALIRVTSLKDLQDKGIVVVRGSDRPIAVFYHDGKISAVDNRCPHMGFPMHQGTVKDGMVTCHWHQARFDLRSGCTFDLFADDLPPFDTEVQDGVVYVWPTPRQAATETYYAQRLTRGMEQNISLIQGKGLIGLLHAGVNLKSIVRTIADYGCRNHDNWQSGMTSLTAVANLCDFLDDQTAFYGLFKGISLVAADSAGVAPRRRRHPLEGGDHDLEPLKRWLRHWTLVRHRDGSERTLLTAIERGASVSQLTDALISAACDRPYAGGGHVLDFCNKAFELLEWIGEEQAANVLPLLLPGLTSARGGEEDAAWRHPVDLIPPLRDAETALPELMRQGQGKRWSNDASINQTLLGDDPLAMLEAMQGAVRDGATPAALSKLVCYAAAMRLARFAQSNDVRDWLNPLHTFTYCNAVHQCVSRAATPDVVRGIFHGAISVYMERFLNVPPAKLPGQRESLDGLPSDGQTLLDQLLTALDQKHEVDEAARLVARYSRLGLPIKPLIDRLTFAVVREDLDFHALQALEAGVRQIQLWPAGSPEIEHILVGVTRYLAAQCPTQRAGLQTARIALRLHRGDTIYEDEDEASTEHIDESSPASISNSDG